MDRRINEKILFAGFFVLIAGLLITCIFQAVTAESSGDSEFVTKWGTDGSIDGKFSYPRSIAADADGYLHISETGFYPEEHGYQFGNFNKSSLSWDLFELIFGEDKVEYPNGMPDKIAQEFYAQNFKNIANEGSCFGMAASCLDIFQNSQNGQFAWDFGNSRYTNLDKTWTYFSKRDIPDSIFTVEELIGFYHPRQLDFDCQYDRDKYSGFSRVHTELKNRMVNKDVWITDPVVLDMWWESGESDEKGHSVVPYKMFDDPVSKIAKVYVYDTRYPGEDHGLSFWIKFDLNENSGYFGYDDLWGSEYTDLQLSDITMIRLSAIQKQAELPFYESVSFNSVMSVLFTNIDGLHLGTFNGERVSEIPGAFRVRITGDGSQFPETYYTGNLDLKRELIGNDFGIGSISMFRPDTMISADISVTPTSVDELYVPPDGSIVAFVSGQGTDSVRLALYKEGDDFGRMAIIEGSSFEGGEATALAFDDDFESIRIINSGTDREYTLILEQFGYNAGRLDNPVTLQIGSHSSAVITPESWDDLESSSIQVEQDTYTDAIIERPEIHAGLSATVELDPRVVNKGESGTFITAYIELPYGYDPNTIIAESTRLNTINARTVEIPSTGPYDVGDYDWDGITDLMVKFDRQAVCDELNAELNEISLTIQLEDGTYFTGYDVIEVKK